MSSPYRFDDLSDEQIVIEAASRQGTVGGPIAEMMRRLKVAIEVQERSSTELGNRIERLNVRLFRATVAIGALTLVGVLVAGVQALIALGVIHR
jgi:hypothetical protein